MIDEHGSVPPCCSMELMTQGDNIVDFIMPINTRIEERSQAMQEGGFLGLSMRQEPTSQPKNTNLFEQCASTNNSAVDIQMTDEHIPASAFDYASAKATKLEVLCEPTDVSDGSTLDSNPEVDILPNDNEDSALALLQGLNSDNLMQFSQQSVIQDLMLKEQQDIKPNLDVLPTIEEHDIGGYKFQLNLSSKRKGKVNWIYSENLNKVYLRMNEIFTIDAVYTPKIPLQNLRIRVLICFLKEVSEPVLRCQNHTSKDTEPHPKKRHSLLRCENPSAEYLGSAEGKSINDRYSVVIPLSTCVAVRDDNSIAHPVALKFTCQNSCIGRKETSLVFLLESMNGEILSQRVLDVKICSCPKRDNDAEERNVAGASKRKLPEDMYPGESKHRRKECGNGGQLKEERSSSDLEDNNSNASDALKQFDVQRTPSGSIRLVMEICSRDAALFAVESAMNKVASKIVTEPRQAPLYSKNFRKLKRLHDKTLKL